MYYYTDIEEINVDANCYLARIQLESEETEYSMFNKYYNILHFPDYFGFNWDAFDECISDLSWIDKSFIFIVHSPLDVSDKEFLYRYLKCIDDVEKEWTIFINSIDDNPKNAWKRQCVKYVKFYFHECDRKKIYSTLTNNHIGEPCIFPKKVR